MPVEEHIQRIIELHKSEADDEYRREAGDDPVYDRITWDNLEPFLLEGGWILDTGGAPLGQRPTNREPIRVEEMSGRVLHEGLAE